SSAGPPPAPPGGVLEGQAAAATSRASVRCVYRGSPGSHSVFRGSMSRSRRHLLHSGSVIAHLLLLHMKHVGSRLLGESDPPLDSGTTWSGSRRSGRVPQ